MEVLLASAGTGKTYALVERYLEALSRFPPYRLAAVTFTRAAAAELETRLVERLRLLAKEGNHPLAERAATYADLIPGAPIGTIHSFFAELLRQNAPRVGVDPDFLRLEADEVELIFDEEARSHLFEADGAPDGALLADLVALFERRGLAARLEPEGPVSTARWRTYQEVEKRYLARLTGARLGPTEIELWARRLLIKAGTNPDLAARIRGRLKMVFVDEYQDTSPLQGEVFERLEALGVELVVVGDPKQSIYAFRNADVAVFRRALKRADRAHTLGTSYRHARRLVAFLNRLTGALAEKNLGFGPVEAPDVKPRPEAPEGRVELLCVEDAAPIAELRAREAAGVAAWVRREAEARRDDGGQPGWDRVAVLVRSRRAYEALRPALEAAGVPHVFVGARGFFRLREVRDLIQAARAALDPGDRLALAAFLRGPFAGLDLAAVTGVLKAEAPLEALAAFPEVRARLLHLKERAQALDPVRFFEYLARERLIDGQSYLERLAPAARANVDRLLFLLAGKRVARLELLLRELEELRALDAEAEVAEGGLRAVRIYTFHGAKGLEWPAVAVFDLARGERNDPERVYVEPGRGRFAFAGDPAYAAFKEDWAARQADEAYRLLYVALSRPREALLFSYSVPLKKAKDGAQKPRLQGLARALEALGVRDWPEVTPFTPGQEKSAPPKDDPLPEPDPRLRRALSPGPLPRVTSPSALKSERLRPVEAGEGDEILAEPDPLGRTLARVVGTLFHFAVAAGWGPERMDWLLAKEVAQGLTEAERDRVQEELTGLLVAYRAMLGEALPPPEVRDEDHAELPFVLPWGGTVIEGVIDRLYRVGEAWYLEDYKTDRARGDLRAYAREMGYDFQLAVYAEAVRRAKGVLPRARLVFVREQKLIPYTTGELEAALDRLELL